MVILGVDGGVLLGLLAAARQVGLPKPIPVGDWQARRSGGDASNAVLNARFWPAPDVTSEDAIVTRLDGAPVPVRIYRRRGSSSSAMLVYAHGGGMIAGNLDVYDSRCSAYAQATGIPVASVDYGLAPEHPYPRAIDDVTTVLHWVHERADELGVDRGRIGIAGDSAGGGIAAGVALKNRDERRVAPDGPRLACQLLVYAMLDDRTVAPPADDPRMRSRWITWSYADNVTGWSALLGRDPGGVDTPAYAAPARAGDLAGLPPTFIDVGTLDIFHEEDRAFAQRLAAAGVDVEWREIAAVPHGFDFFAPRAEATRRAWAARFDFLSRRLG